MYFLWFCTFCVVDFIPKINNPSLEKLDRPFARPVTWYGINYTGTQVTQWDFQNKGTRTSPPDFPLF